MLDGAMEERENAPFVFNVEMQPAEDGVVVTMVYVEPRDKIDNAQMSKQLVFTTNLSGRVEAGVVELQEQVVRLLDDVLAEIRSANAPKTIPSRRNTGAV